MRYRNKTFDKLYNQALNAKSIEEANRFFLQAEQVVMNDAPVIVLWYDEGYRLIQSYIKNFPNNPMQYRDFTQVYLEREKHSKQDI
jgi:peptide/nickel transport system substrate-binding protein